MGQQATATVIDSFTPETQCQRMDLQTFVQWQPEEVGHYELVDGIPTKMQPTGSHVNIAGFLAAELIFEIRCQKLPYSLPRNCLVQSPDRQSGYIPDVLVAHREHLKEEPRWSTASTIENGAMVPLVIEVVSTNWSNDYGRKLLDYGQLGIQEYWIVDYRGLGAARYIGTPKQPTITILQLEDGEYIEAKYRAGDTLISGIFPDLTLTADEIFAAAD